MLLVSVFVSWFIKSWLWAHFSSLLGLKESKDVPKLVLMQP